MSDLFLKRFLIVFLLVFSQAPALGDDTSSRKEFPVWSQEETKILRSLWIGSLPPSPKDPSNSFAENQKAARLGEKLFFDPRFSKNGNISCGTCHRKDYAFTEDMPRGHGIGATVRRTQPLIGMAYLSWFFWDGRADSLWAQALGPPENANEHGVTRTLCAQIISRHYKREYEELFGTLPDFPADICPPVAKPDPEDKEAYSAWIAMPSDKAEAINLVYANMGKAIAAYVRLIVPGPSRFDRYVEALLRKDATTMSETLHERELEGLRLFIGKAKCVTCHSGPLFTNGEFRKTGVYQPADLPPDSGRAGGIAKALSLEFNCFGKYSDAAKSQCAALSSLTSPDANAAKYQNAFKVPTLRNVAERAPYMHAGQYWALWEVVRFFSNMKPAPGPGSDLSSGMDKDLLHGGLSEAERDRIEAFLRTLSGPLLVPDFGGVTVGPGGHHQPKAKL